MEQTDHEVRTLVAGSVRGDAESCRKLYDHLVEKVFPFVRYRSGSHEDALDITQEVFIDFFTAISHFTYQTPAQLYAYVFVITRRKLARYYERSKLKSTAPFDENETPLGSGQGTPTAPIETEVQLALEQLDEKAREIVTLHHFSKYTFGEIAELLNMNESAVRVAHHRALAVLKETFKEKDFNTQL